MGKYAVEVEGSGFHVPVEPGGCAAQGFLVTVFLEARDEDAACDRAIEMLMDDPWFAENVGRHAAPVNAALQVIQWYELESFECCTLPRTGFIFFSDDRSNIEAEEVYSIGAKH